DVVNLNLCADVDTTGRLVKDEDIGIRVDPLTDNNLLLVAAGKLADDLVDRRGLDAQGRDIPFTGFENLLFIQERAVAAALHVCQNQIGTDGLRQYQALTLAVFRQDRDALADGLTGRLDMYFFALDVNLAAVNRISTEDSAH